MTGGRWVCRLDDARGHVEAPGGSGPESWPGRRGDDAGRWVRTARIAHEVSARPWHESGEPNDKVEGLEEDVGCTLVEGAFELVNDEAVAVDAQALERERGSAAQALEFIGLVGLTDDGGVQREAILLFA